ncbi:MAG: Nif3-like dinuclear metal center hexameric protein [Planctomycetota bacterium]|jgi:dinuclear metal center YbgI/SA1388 family protein
MKVGDVVQSLAAIAPPAQAAEWDNVGLLIGDRRATVRTVMLCIDLTEAVLAEALASKAQMVMAYHPPIFKPVARLTAEASPIVYAATRKGLAVYSMHTALDAARGGTNDVLAEAMGLCCAKPLTPAEGEARCKIVVFAPTADLSGVAEAAFAAGAGRIGNYEQCAFFGHGVGTFVGGADTTPTVGVAGRQEAVEEVRFETVVPSACASAVIEAIRRAHSYEEPAIDVYPLQSQPAGVGQGRIGRLGRPVSATALLTRVKKALGLKHLWVARPAGGSKTVRLAACAAGSAGGLFSAAVEAGATFYLTGEMRHHDALAAAASGLTVACTGHSNSERAALKNVAKGLRTSLPGLKVLASKKDRDPFVVV